MAVAIRFNNKAILRAVQNESESVLKCLCHKIERKAKQKVPVLTGNLKRSIRAIIKPGIKRIYAGGNAPGVGTPVEYAGYVELGTSKMAAQPYLRPAVEEIDQNEISQCIGRS